MRAMRDDTARVHVRVNVEIDVGIHLEKGLVSSLTE